MSLKIIIGILFVIAATLYIYLFNPSKIKIVVYTDVFYEIPTAFFMFGLFFLGALISTILQILKSYKRSFRNWRESVHLKKERQTEENYIKGLRALWEGRIKEAKSAFQAVLQKQSDHVDSIVKLGDAFRLEGSYEDAIKMHQKGRSLEGDSIMVLRCLEADYRQDNRKRELIEILEKLKRLDQGNAEYLIKLRDIFVDEEDWLKASDLQKELVQMGKNLGSFDEEVKYLGAIQYEVAKLLAEKGEFENAIAEYRKSIKNQEKFAPSYLMLGDLFVSLQNEVEAVKIWKTGFRATKVRVIIKRLEHYYLEREKPDLALEVYQEAIDMKDSDPYLSLLLGECYLRLEMIEEAYKELQKVEKSFGYLPEFHILMGRIYQKSGQPESAEAEYKGIFDSRGLVELNFACQNCSKRYLEWTGRCPGCHQWNTIDIGVTSFLNISY